MVCSATQQMSFFQQPYFVKTEGGYIVQNFNTIMKQAKKMQERMGQLQKELETKTVEAQAGGGMVRVVVNEGIRKSQEMASSEMGKITGGLNIPGL
jgi:DNA-binding protein YbaB